MYFCLSFTLIHMLFFFFFNDTATTEIYTLSLHDALPIFGSRVQRGVAEIDGHQVGELASGDRAAILGLDTGARSEEHTSELQSRPHLVCRLLLEKKKNFQMKRKRTLNQLRLHYITGCCNV